jgi:hypothetical protein
MLTDSRRLPDVDVSCATGRHPYHLAGTPTQFRLRAWVDDRLVVVSDAPANRGASVTNAIEHVAAIVEAHLDVRLVEHDLATWCGWQLIQHDARTGSLDFVRFAGRDDDDLAERPEWSPLPRGMFAWLYSAVS